MKVRGGIVAGLLFLATMGSASAARDLSISHYRLDKEGGSIEVQATHPGDKQTRDRVRQELLQEARNGIPSASPEMQEHQKEILYRYENTERGGRLRIIAKSREALLAVQDFLHSQISSASGERKVVFDFVENTSLVVVPVRINGHGPYRFLLDTGASNTVLSLSIADGLGIPRGRSYTLATGGGNVTASVRKLSAFTVGPARLENVEAAVANVPLFKTMKVDGVLGSDYLRRFKISIDYDNQVMDIEPCCPDTISRVLA
jgi:predicted aspartyl protease